MEILVFVEYYLPGFKSGGPIRSITNLVEHLGDETKFKIITLDRDFSDTKSYRRIQVNSWNQVGKADVFYVSANKFSLKFFRKIIRSTEFDKVYINGIFSYPFNIKPMILRRMGFIPMIPMIIAPRGQLKPGALQLKWLKKRIFLLVAKWINIYVGVFWHATNELEAKEIQYWFGDQVPIVIAPNLAPLINEQKNLLHERKKYPGKIKVIFLARVSLTKNLDFALKKLELLTGIVRFDIYGPIDDEKYWQECQKTIKTLPKNIEVNYIGPISNDKVNSTLSEYHLFFLPTLGENFGHAILEAFMAGCPVLISDQTPWRKVEEKRAGWDISLSEPERFHQILDHCVKMNGTNFRELSKKTKEYGLQISRNDASLKIYRNLFHGSAEGIF